jgi:arylsulfatase A-like enzyme
MKPEEKTGMKKPNLLIFVTDQQHAETIGEQGLCRTPRLNQMILEGVNFTQAYTPTPMCTPARTSLVTGLYPHQHKLVYNTHGTDAEPYSIEGIETIGTALAAEGYRTVYAGKWHVGKTPPEANGFQEVLMPAAVSTEKGDFSDVITITDKRGEQLLAATAGYPAGDAFALRLARSVKGWIEQQPLDGEPFLMMACCHEPHVPWIVPEPYASMYDPESLPEWDSYGDNYTDKPLTYTKHYTNVNFCRLQNDWLRMAKALAKYYGAVTMVDDAFGVILDSLEKSGLIENTIIIFTSDHGELLGRHALIGKNELALDDIIRVPFVMYGQNRFVPAECDQFVSLCDVFNTVMELVGSDARNHLDSRSLLPYLQGQPEKAEHRQEIIVQHHGTTFPNTVRAIRTAKHKYVFRAHEIDELYDLESDPSERINRIGEPSYKDQILELREQLLEWAEQTGDPARHNIRLFFRNPDHPE